MVTKLPIPPGFYKVTAHPRYLGRNGYHYFRVRPLLVPDGTERHTTVYVVEKTHHGEWVRVSGPWSDRIQAMVAAVSEMANLRALKFRVCLISARNYLISTSR